MESQRRLLLALKSCQINGLDDRKLFVTGLCPGTRRYHLQCYFKNYGIIEDISVISARDSRRSRFGFVTFTTPEAVERVLSERKHLIDGRKVCVKIARGKILVGRVPRRLSIDEVLHYFGQFGKVSEYGIPYASEHFKEQVVTITFASQQCVTDLLKIEPHVVGGFELNVMNALQTRDQKCNSCEALRMDYMIDSGTVETYRRDYTVSDVEEIQSSTIWSFQYPIRFLLLIMLSYVHVVMNV